MKGLAEAETAAPLAWVVRLGGEPVPGVKMPAASMSSEPRCRGTPLWREGASGQDAGALKHCRLLPPGLSVRPLGSFPLYVGSR